MKYVNLVTAMRAAAGRDPLFYSDEGRLPGEPTYRENVDRWRAANGFPQRSGPQPLRTSSARFRFAPHERSFLGRLGRG